ncbi:hypothetical protein PFISCL1PPCAC_9489, partial [Pristionchus fissidentatus]
TSNLWLEIVIFLFVCNLLISPPDPLVQSGLTFEQLLPSCASMNSNPLIYLELKVLVNRLCASALPVVFELYLAVNHGLHKYLLYLTIVNLIISLYCMIKLALKARNIRKGLFFTFAPRFGFSTLELFKMCNNMMIRGSFIADQSYSDCIYVDADVFINERRFGYSIERTSELIFTSIGNSFNAHSTPGELTEWLNIRAVNRLTNKSYNFRFVF